MADLFAGPPPRLPPPQSVVLPHDALLNTFLLDPGTDGEHVIFIDTASGACARWARLGERWVFIGGAADLVGLFPAGGGQGVRRGHFAEFAAVLDERLNCGKFIGEAEARAAADKAKAKAKTKRRRE